MTRSSYKGPYVDEKLLKKAQAAAQGKVIKTWSRDCQIHPDFVGKTFGVHNGKDHTPVFVTEVMIGHRLGEFAPTRKFKGHPKKSASPSA